LPPTAINGGSTALRTGRAAHERHEHHQIIWLEGHFRDPRDKLAGATGRTEPHYYYYYYSAEPGAALALRDTSGRSHGRWSGRVVVYPRDCPWDPSDSGVSPRRWLGDHLVKSLHSASLRFCANINGDHMACSGCNGRAVFPRSFAGGGVLGKPRGCALPHFSQPGARRWPLVKAGLRQALFHVYRPSQRPYSTAKPR
jgi:hypothetical protein